MISVDASGLLMFLGLLSQLYQGLGPISPPLYYEQEAIKLPDPLTPPLQVLHRFDPSTTPPWELPERKAMDFVGFRLTPTQLVEIHGTVAEGQESLWLSRVDVIVGLLARCLSGIEPEAKPIDTILNVINVRTFIIFPTAPLICCSTGEWVYTL